MATTPRMVLAMKPHEKLRAWTRAKQGRVTKLAAIMGVSRNIIYRWINGGVRPPEHRREALEKATGVEAVSWGGTPAARP